MKRFFFSLIAVLSLSQSAFANCWMQCIATVPLTGKCITKVKMCNITDADKALESLGHDFGAAYENIRNEWVILYGRLPEEVQTILDKYPLTMATLIIPGTREYTLFTLTLEQFVGKAKGRAHDVHIASQGAPDWKKKQLNDGYGFLFFLEGVDLTNYDYAAADAAPIPDKYDAVWDAFLACEASAIDLNVGLKCLKTLKANASVL